MIDQDSRQQVITKERLIGDLQNLGLQKGHLVNVKASLSSIGWIDGGINTLLDALISVVTDAGTIVTDAFVPGYPLPLSEKTAKNVSRFDTPSYAGALANAMIKHPKMFRSKHPIQKFVAIGREAEELMNNHGPEDMAYDVLRVMAEKDAINLKIGTDEKVVGVGTTHVAICLLGLKQEDKNLGIMYEDDDGNLKFFKRNWPGGCPAGFNSFIPVYDERGAILAKGFVGNSEAKITSMKQTLAIELELLKDNPAAFFCKDPGCRDCRLTWEFSTGKKIPTYCHYLKKRFRLYFNRRTFKKVIKKLFS